MPAASFFWHDYETFGADPRRDRPCQFAGVRTDESLQEIEEPLTLWCRPAPDVLPSPEAVLLTGITPQDAERLGQPEPDFAAAVHEQLARPGTCGVGYNSIRFDDEFTRHLFWRNFLDPYAREWQQGNSRWDLIDLVRLCYALRPEGLAWPRHADGAPSFRLEDLARANGLLHDQAHDALSDVRATLALARRIRDVQPRLFEFYLGLRSKQRALALLDWANGTPVVHVSSRYPAERGCLALVMPLAPLPDQPNAVVVVDLDADPDPLLRLDADAIRDRVFTRREDLPEGESRIPLKLVRANRCPALAPISVLQNVDLDRIGLDRDRCLSHAVRLRGVPGLGTKVAAVFAREGQPAVDPELALYDGFVPESDRALATRVRRAAPGELAALASRFEDARLRELLFRYRARHYPTLLDPEERARWDAFRRRRLTRDDGLSTFTLETYAARIMELRAARAGDGTAQARLDALDAWGRALAEAL